MGAYSETPAILFAQSQNPSEILNSLLANLGGQQGLDLLWQSMRLLAQELTARTESLSKAETAWPPKTPSSCRRLREEAAGSKWNPQWHGVVWP